MAKVQPKSPQHEGVDPLTKGDTLYPREETQKISSELQEQQEKDAQKQAKKVAKTVKDQKTADAKSKKAVQADLEKAEIEKNGTTADDVEITGDNGDGTVEAKVDGEETTLTPADEQTKEAVSEGDDTSKPQTAGTKN